MNKTYHSIILGCLVLFLLFSCKKDDDSDTYSAIEINTKPDTAQLLQSQSALISIFENDENIPDSGILSFSTPGSGTINLKPNSSNTITDDQLEYTATGTYTGTDSFTYTICDETGANCKTETVSITVHPFSPVNADLTEIPYPKLSDYHFFEGNLAEMLPVNGVLPYEPISSLFSDYALKKRFVWMPFGSNATYEADGKILNFPVGTILIKSFYYNNVLPEDATLIIETRLMIKRETGWTFAEYFWNDEQTDAFLDETGNGSFKSLQWNQNGTTRSVNYRMPSTSECYTCHKSDVDNIPIGVKPQNLNGNYPFPEGTKNQLQKWIEVGYLEGAFPQNVETVVDYMDSSHSLDLRVRSYFDINCASCHSDGGHCNYRSMRFAFDENESLASRGVCITPDTDITLLTDEKIIKPGDPVNSVIFFRLNITAEEYRMPLLGRRIVHDEGVALIEEWINSLTNECD